MEQPRSGAAGPSRSGVSRSGVRSRLTSVAVGVVALALLVGGVILLVLLQTSLVASAESAARQKVQDVITELDDLDVADASEYIAATAHAGQFVQLLDPGGYVVASSDPGAASTPLSAQRPGRGRTLSQEVSSLPSVGDNDNFYIVTTGVQVGEGDYTVIVASTVQVPGRTPSPRWPGSCWGPLRCCWRWLRSPCGCSWDGPSARSKGSGGRSPGSTPSAWTNASMSRPRMTKSVPSR